MPKLIRVKDPATGHEYDVPASRLVVRPGLIVLEKPTGKTKPRLPLGTPIPGGRVDRRRAASRPRTTQQTPAAGKPSADSDGHAVTTEQEI